MNEDFLALHPVVTRAPNNNVTWEETDGIHAEYNLTRAEAMALLDLLNEYDIKPVSIYSSAEKKSFDRGLWLATAGLYGFFIVFLLLLWGIV